MPCPSRRRRQSRPDAAGEAAAIQLEKSWLADELDAPGASGYQPRSNPVRPLDDVEFTECIANEIACVRELCHLGCART